MEDFQNKMPKGFGYPGCMEVKTEEIVLYAGTKCEPDSIMMATFLDPDCTTPVPDAPPLLDVKFKAGYLDCYSPDGGKTYMSAYQNGWGTSENEVFPIRLDMSEEKFDGIKDETMDKFSEEFEDFKDETTDKFQDDKDKDKFDDFNDPKLPDTMDDDKFEGSEHETMDPKE